MVPNGVANTFTNTIFIAPSILPGAYDLSITALDDVGAVGGGIALVTVGASTETWAGVGTDTKWDTNPNWAIETGETAAYAPGYVGDTLNFAGKVGLAPNMDNGYSVNGLVFTNGAGSFVISSTTGSILTNIGAGITNLSTNLETLNVPVTLGLPGQEFFNTAGGNLTLGQGLADQGGGFTVIGSNTLTLSGASTYTGPLTVRQGAMNLTGTTVSTNLVTIGSASGSNAVLNIMSGGSLVVGSTASNPPTSIIVGNATNCAAVLTLAAGGTLGDPGQLSIGNGSGSYSYFKMTGGTATVGNYFAVGLNTDHAQFDMSGGTLYVTTNQFTTTGGGSGATNQYGVANISGGTVWSTNYLYGAADRQGGMFVGEAGHGTVNISGTAVVNVWGLTNLTLGVNPGSYGLFDLLGGTITTSQVCGQAASNTTFNFNGGKLVAAPQVPGFVPAPSGVFMSGLTNAYVYPGGAFIDDGGLNITISQPLQAPTGYGVSSIPILSGGSGYVAPPIVNISGGTGFGAAAVATVANGAVTGFTIVNPGSGYSVADTFTVSLYGGGITPTTGTAATINYPVLLTPNGSGGLTYSSLGGAGTGTLTLTAPETYAGTTTVSSGTLAIGLGGSIANSTNFNVKSAGTFDVTGIAGITLFSNQTISGSGHVNGVVTASSGARVYPGTDPAIGTLSFYSGLNLFNGAIATFDVSTSGTSGNDQVVVDGTLALQNNTIHIKAPNTSANLDTVNPYTLMTATSVGGFPNSKPAWDAPVPANTNVGFWIVEVSGSTVQLVHSASSPPGGTGSAIPSTGVIRNQPFTINVVTTTGGSGAAITQVEVDTSPLGGSVLYLTQVGSSATWTVNTRAPAGALPGPVTLAALVTDANGLSGTVPVTFTVITTTQTWNGGDTGAPDFDSDSDVNLNWVSGGAPGYVGDSVIFAGTVGLAPVLDQAYTFNGIGFANGAGLFTISSSGFGLTLVNGVTNNSANVETLNVPVTLGGSATTFNAASGNLALANALSGAGQLNVAGPGGVTLGGINTYVGNTTINPGATLTMGPGGQWQNALSQEVYAGTITNNGTLVYDGAANQTNTGIISGGGALVVDSPNASLGNSLDLTAFNTFSGGTIVNTYATLNLHVGGGAGTIQSSLTINAGGVVNTWVQDSMGYTVGTCVPSLYFNGGTFANQFANNQSFATQWYMTGGTVTTVAVPQGDGINFNTGFGITTYPTNVSVLFNAPIVIRGTGLTFNIGKGTVPGGVDIICNSNINGGSYVIMSGTGTMQWNDTNSFTGGVQINGGELQVGVAEQPGVGSPLGFGTISFGGGSLQYSAANQYDYSGRFSTAAGQLFSIDTAGQAVTLGTNLAGNGSTLTKLGLGTLTLTAANAYTGLTTVSNGILLLGTGGSIAASSGVSIAAGATFDVSALPSPYTFGAGSSLIASGTTASPAAINTAGAVSLGSVPITLNYDSTDAAPQPALNVTGALSLNANPFTVNTLNGLPLANGIYVVVQASSVATAGTYPPVQGTAIGPTSKGAISVSGAQVLLTISSVNLNAPPIQFGFNGNTLNLSWPTNSGWTLQSNSINIAVPGDWHNIPGSSSVTTFPINVNTGKTNVFYRLFLP